ncbi:family 52 olfactory receptor, partial [Vibrio cholerae]|uniref:family 52 olfactory receptor n=2 Tax=Vibrio cholerae TaxID=666 RepID=UPI001F348AAA
MDAAVIQDVSVPSLELYVPSPEVDTFGINPKQVFDIHQLKEMKSGRIMAMAALHRDRYLTISNKRAL